MWSSSIKSTRSHLVAFEWWRFTRKDRGRGLSKISISSSSSSVLSTTFVISFRCEPLVSLHRVEFDRIVPGIHENISEKAIVLYLHYLPSFNMVYSVSTHIKAMLMLIRSLLCRIRSDFHRVKDASLEIIMYNMRRNLVHKWSILHSFSACKLSTACNDVCTHILVGTLTHTTSCLLPQDPNVLTEVEIVHSTSPQDTLQAFYDFVRVILVFFGITAQL